MERDTVLAKYMYALDMSTYRANEMADFILMYYMSGILK